MRPPQGAEWLLILIIVLLLFGAKRLPDMARGLGRSLRILKAETRGMNEDGDKESAAAAEPPAVDAAPTAPTVGAEPVDITEDTSPPSPRQAAPAAEDRPGQSQ